MDDVRFGKKMRQNLFAENIVENNLEWLKEEISFVGYIDSFYSWKINLKNHFTYEENWIWAIMLKYMCVEACFQLGLEIQN